MDQLVLSLREHAQWVRNFKAKPKEYITPITSPEVLDAAADEIERLTRDARRYRRLQILGCAVAGTPQLDAGTVVRFTLLDAIVDRDLESFSTRGEAEPL